MTNLGSFGSAVREMTPDGGDRDTFEFCGEQFTVYDTIPPMLMLQLGAAATGKIEEQEGLAAIWEAMRCSLTKPAGAPSDEDPEPTPDEAEFQRYYRLAVKYKVGLADLMRVAMALFQAQSGRPTERRPASSDGPSSVSPSSNAWSSTHQDLAHLRPVADLLAG